MSRYKKDLPKPEKPVSKTKEIKKIIKYNKAKALSIAVAITVGTSLTACTSKSDESYYLPGTYGNSSSSSQQSGGHSGYTGGYHHYGSYYYSRGATYKSGSWGSDGSVIGHSYSGGGGTYGVGG